MSPHYEDTTSAAKYCPRNSCQLNYAKRAMKTEFDVVESPKRKFTEAWGRLVQSTEWDYFVTITTRHTTSEAGARRLAQRFHEIMTRRGIPNNFLWVAEPHKTKDGYHLHGLVKAEPPKLWVPLCNQSQWATIVDASRTACGGDQWKNQKGVKGRWHRVKLESYEGGKGEYLQKYLQKQMLDWDFFVS